MAKYKQEPRVWVQLFMINNCFNDKHKKHLGLKYKGKWYCITHNNMNEKLLIPKTDLDMRDISPKDEYLKRIYDSAPNKVNPTTMSISTRILSEYITIYGNGKNE